MSSYLSVRPVGPRSRHHWGRLSCIGWGALSLGLMVIGAPILPMLLPRPAVAVLPIAPRPTLKLGSEGAAVKELQATLRLLGLYRGTVDGVYGPATTIAVTRFQRSAGLPADGIVGQETWNRLLPTSPGSTSATLPSAAPTPSSGTSHGFPIPAESRTGVGANPSPSPAVTVPAAIAQGPAAAATSTPSPTPAVMPANPALATLPILRRGMAGPAVEGLQTRLQAIGVFRGTIDGVFGPETQAAVEAIQRTLKLEPDGIVGPSTWLALLKR